MRRTRGWVFAFVVTLLTLLRAVPAAAQIRFVTINSASVQSGTSCSVYLANSAGVQYSTAYTVVFLVGVANDAATVTGVTSTYGTGAYSRQVAISNTGNVREELWAGTITSASSGYYPIQAQATLSGNAKAVCFAAVYSGVAAFGGTNSGTSSAANPSISLTTQDSNNWCVAGFAGVGTTLATVGTGNLRATQATGGNPPSSNVTNNVGDNTVASPGTCTVSITDSEKHWASTILDLQPRFTITGMSPTSGSTGTSVAITGQNFGATQGASTVAFNGVAATPTSWSPTQIVVPVPAAATTGEVIVTVAGYAIDAGTFRVTPKITSVTPSSGIVGALVTIQGTSFGASQGTSSVAFNGTASKPTSWSDTSITAPVPPGATTGQLVVTVNSSASNGVSFTVLPSISNLTPSFGPIGTAVNVSGWLFGSSQGTSTVTFNGVTAAPTSWTNASVVAPVPAAATTGPVVVTVGGVASNAVNFTLTPSITDVSPASGNPGTSVTIKGANFGATQGASAAAFNGIPATVTNWSAQSIVAPVPAGATTGPVTVTVGGATSNGVIFTLNPSITSTSPSSGPVGTVVTIVGSGFGGSQGTTGAVSFNSVPATPTSWSGTTIFVPVPAGATTGPVVVAVNGVSSNDVTFTVGAGTISGTVTRASDGSAVSGALVEALQSNVAKASTNTAANGTYTISNLLPGTYDVRVSTSGLGSAIQAGNSVAANATTTLNFALSNPGTDSGKVTKSDGVTPISGATVTAREGSAVVGTATADATGSFSIGGLGPGTYTIQASAPGYGTQTQTGVSITAGGTTTTNFSLAGQSVISYFYDDLSRLIGASDSQSNTAVYSYDAVGNLLSITNNPSSQVTIIGFDPQSGPIGASVTIGGTGFGPTASQNTVSFNGTAATITSATATQLVATVPAGAASGAITVTAPGGSATSSSTFTVTASSGAPTISGFSPAIAATGAAVTITGTNFDSNVNNDVTEINVSRLSVSSATSTTIVATVGNNATSGRVSVTAPLGKAVSSADFYVVPAPYTTSNVGFTGRTTLGGTITFNLTAASQIGLVLFDATPGQRLALLFSTNYAGCGIYTSGTNLTVYNPNGLVVTSGSCLGSGSYLDTQTLPVSGTYMILVAPQSGTSGSVTLTLYNVPPDVIGAITPGGSPVTVTTSAAGQNALLTFSGTQNQRVSLLFSNSTYTGCGAFVTGLVASIFNPDGSTLAAGGCVTSGSYFDTMTLPQSGAYTIKVDPQSSYTGSITLTLYNVPPDVTATITPGGSSVTVTTTIPGQNAAVTFGGTQNQRVSLLFSNSTYMGCGAFVTGVVATIFNPDGSTLAPGNCVSSGSFFDAMTLPQNGTYTIKVDPQSSYTGSITLTLYNVVDSTAAISPGGSPVTVTTTVPGQNAAVTFTGSQNQRVSLVFSNSSYPGCGAFVTGVVATIFNPDGSTLAPGNCVSSGSFFDAMTLPQNGTYTIKVDPQSSYTGSITLTLYNVIDVSGSVTVNGSSLPVTISTPGQNAEITFAGTSGQSVTVQLSGSTICTVNVSLLPPGGGSALTSTSTCNAAFNLASQTLSTTGTYEVLIDPQGASTGSITVAVTSP